MLIGAAARPAEGESSPNVVDVTLQSFGREVIEASMRLPVLVDFWAPWCGPCKQLTPVLERLVSAAKGKIRLAKINIDECPEIAQQLRIQSVPTVYAFVGGQPATGFAGVQPESQIKALIEKLIGGAVGAGDAEAMMKHAQDSLQTGDYVSATAAFQSVLESDPQSIEAIGGLARCMIGEGLIDDAEQLLSSVESKDAGHAAITGANAALTLAREAGQLPSPGDLEEALNRNAADHKARYELATSMFLRGYVDEAMEELCKIVRKDRAWEDDLARKQMVKFFEALGPTHTATIKGRRMLSSVLFS